MSDTKNPADLLALAERLAAQASEGPWRSGRDDEESGSITYAIIPPNEGATVAWVPEDCNDNARTDAAFIAAARTLVPQLAALARYWEARARVAEAAYQCLMWRDHPIDGPKVTEAYERVRGSTFDARDALRALGVEVPP